MRYRQALAQHRRPPLVAGRERAPLSSAAPWRVWHHRVVTYRILLTLAASTALAGAACGGKTSAASPTPAAATGPIGTLTRLENGDRACYVILTTAAGERSIEGDFDLCPGGSKDASALIGQPVTWTTRPAKVLAAACEGDMDCGKSDDVDLVDTITPVP